MKQMVYIASRFPLPGGGGREKMICQHIEMLQDVFDITFFYFGEGDIGKLMHQYPAIKNSFQINAPGLFRIVLNLFTRKTLQEALFYSPKSKKNIIKVVENLKPDFIYCDMIRMSSYVQDLQFPKILDYDDLLSIRYERFLQKRNLHSLLGTNSNRVSTVVSYFAKFLPKRWLLKFEQSRIYSREIEVSRYFDALVLVSPNEKEIMESRLHNKKIKKQVQAIPPAFHAISFGDTKSRSRTKFLYIGNLKTAQNLEALQYTAECIIPIAERSYEFHFVGDYDDRAVQYESGRIKLLGYVDNLQELSQEYCALFAPIQTGTGIKLKILDAISFGMPVITTTIGAEGLPLKNEYNCLIGDNINQLSDHLATLSNNPAFGGKLILRSQQDIVDDFAYVNVKTNLLNLCKSIFLT